jgi:hypothetical protein
MLNIREGMWKVEKQMRVSGQTKSGVMLRLIEYAVPVGRIREMALKDELEWLGKVDGWSVKHRELEEKYDIIPERLVDAIKLPTIGSMLCRRWSRGSYLLTCSGSSRWDNQIVVLVR